MKKTQVQLPDALYERARNFASAQEMSLAEVTRRSLEQFLDRFPGLGQKDKKWILPVVDASGKISISAAKLKEILLEDELNSARR
jgi:hypothetical protein